MSNFSLPNNSIIKIFHQNIRGLRTKGNELISHLLEHSPHFLCLTEHHLGDDEITLLNLDNYFLGAHYSRNHYKKGGTCIYVLKNLNISTINLDCYCNDKDIKACAVRLHNYNNHSLCVLTIYRSPSGVYRMFLTKLELILRKLCVNKVNVIICGDFNVNFMVD
jgi:exonuclease III